MTDDNVKWLEKLMDSDLICDEARLAVAEAILHIAFATSTVTATKQA